MSTREIHNYELSDEALLDFASNWEDSGAELASQSTPVTPANQQPHIQTNQPVQSVQLQQQNTIATARSIPHNVNYPPVGYAMPPHSDQFQQFYPFHYGIPSYGVMTFQAAPRLHPSLRQIAPKPQVDTNQLGTRTSSSRPPDFIETVKVIRNKLYDLGGIEDSHEPPEGEVYSKWRKSVIQEWKPVSTLRINPKANFSKLLIPCCGIFILQHNMSHYLMVAKLSNRCFRLVIQIPERLNLRVTQSDFIDLYGKSEDQQYELLCDLLEGRISFQDLKRRRVSFF